MVSALKLHMTALMLCNVLYSLSFPSHTVQFFIPFYDVQIKGQELIFPWLSLLFPSFTSTSEPRTKILQAQISLASNFRLQRFIIPTKTAYGCAVMCKLADFIIVTDPSLVNSAQLAYSRTVKCSKIKSNFQKEHRIRLKGGGTRLSECQVTQERELNNRFSCTL